MPPPGECRQPPAGQRAGSHRPARGDPARGAGPRAGLAPRREQSGGRNIAGRIARAGDGGLRRALFDAATVMAHHARRCGLEACRFPGATAGSPPSWPSHGGSAFGRFRGPAGATVAFTAPSHSAGRHQGPPEARSGPGCGPGRQPAEESGKPAPGRVRPAMCVRRGFRMSCRRPARRSRRQAWHRGTGSGSDGAAEGAHGSARDQRGRRRRRRPDIRGLRAPVRCRPGNCGSLAVRFPD
ncbi:transposase [Poseidonocella sp. HB161398]|uniref:transposase n=1 Tax=Poseidonocella sp. HB161398 TaxID=2320855 RepID=UPI0035158414